MKRVLFICYYFPPMGMGGTQRSSKFVKYLPLYGWDPIVLTVKDVKYYAQDPSLLKEIENRKIIRTESWDPLRLWVRFQTIFKKRRRNPDSRFSQQPSKLLNFLNVLVSGWLLIPDSKILWLPFFIPAALKLIRSQRIQVIYTTSPPHSVHLGGVLLKWLTGCKLVIDFRDDWSGGEAQPCPTLFHKFMNRITEKIVLKTADQVISMCDHLSESLQNKSGEIFNQQKFITLPNGYDPADFSQLLEIKPDEKFTITHCGSISFVSDPEPFLKAIQLIFQKNPELKDEIQVKFFGIDIFGRFDFLINQLGLKQTIRPVKYLTHREALTQIMRSHLLLLTIFKKSKEEIITSKVFEYLASGKPVLLVSGEGEVARLITRLNRGVVLANDDVSGIKNAILQYYSEFKNNKLKFAAPLSVEQFDRKVLAGRLAEVFNELIRLI